MEVNDGSAESAYLLILQSGSCLTSEEEKEGLQIYYIMKKFLKIMLYIMGSMIAIIVVFWLCISYTANYKKTICDTSVSSDGKYELVLQAIGEPDWPFGSASGRLVLKEGKEEVSQTDFELSNDGGNISSSCWEVTWYEDYVEIILSGEEQADEQFILYFDGKIEMQQLTDEE